MTTPTPEEVAACNADLWRRHQKPALGTSLRTMQPLMNDLLGIKEVAK